jgi:hypothetical protein
MAKFNQADIWRKMICSDIETFVANNKKSVALYKDCVKKSEENPECVATAAFLVPPSCQMPTFSQFLLNYERCLHTIAAGSSLMPYHSPPSLFDLPPPLDC